MDLYEMVTLEKLMQIRDMQIRSEAETLDFKEVFSLKKSAGLEIVKDIAAFANTKGGYIIFGVTKNYEWCGLDDRSDSSIDEAELQQLCEKYLDGIIEYRYSIYELDGKEFLIFYVKSSDTYHPFKIVGQYERSQRNGIKKNEVVFHHGDVYCRRGSRSVKADYLFYKQKKQGFRLVNNLPAPPYHCFVGREEQMTQLHKLLLHENTRLLQVDGIGGVGKTSLAYNYCKNLIDNDLEHEFDFLVWMSSKRTVFTPDGEQLIKNYIASYHDVISEICAFVSENTDVLDFSDAVEKVSQFLNQHKVLLVIDNMETLLEDDLINFLFNLPRTAKAILTTRESISNFQMSRMTLQGFLWPNEFQTFLESEYYRLCNKSFHVEYGKYEQLIHKYTKGMPLAVQLVINQLILNAPVEFVINGLKSGETYERLLSFCFEGSIQRLDDIQVDLLYILSIPDMEELFTIQELKYISEYSNDELLEAIQKISALSLCYTGKIKDNQVGYTVPHLTKLYIRRFARLKNDAILERYRKFKLEETEIQASDEQYLLKSRAKTHEQRLVALNIKTVMATFFIAGYEAAMKILDDAEKECPDFAYVSYMKAIIEKQNDSLDSFSKAREAFSKATVMDMDLLEAWIDWAYLEHDNKFLYNARTYFEAALKIDPTNKRANHGYARTIMGIAKKDTDKVLHELANKHFELGYYEWENNKLTNAEIHSNAINAHAHAINSYVYLNDNKGALEICENGLRFEATNPRLLSLRGEIRKKVVEMQSKRNGEVKPKKTVIVGKERDHTIEKRGIYFQEISTKVMDRLSPETLAHLMSIKKR
jgi:hypothetical protein